MPPKKKQKVLVSDLDWCIKHSNTLDIQTFSDYFNYGDKGSANQRYMQILKTKRFKSCVLDSEQFLSAFKKWKGSQQETTFWEHRQVELARQSTESKMRVAAIGALGRLGVEEGDRLANESSASSSNSEPSQSHAPEFTNEEENSLPSFFDSEGEKEEQEDRTTEVADMLEEHDQEELINNISAMDPDESFDSVDAHPKRTFYLKYLDKKGQEEWGGSDNLTAQPENTSVIASKLKEFRHKSVIGAKHNKSLSDTRTMSLSFIFPQGHILKEKSLCEYLNEGSCLPGCATLPLTAPPYINTIFSELLKISQDVDNNIIQTELPELAKDIITGFANYLKQWNLSPYISENQFAEQAVFPLLLPLFLFKTEYEISKYDKTMHGDSSYKPDLLVKLNLPKKQQIDFFICEVKKHHENLSNQYESDYVKIHKEMKVIIDYQVDVGVNHPVAFSLLVEGYDLTLFKMELEYVGEYRSTIAGKCRTIRDRGDTVLLGHGICLMEYLEVELNKLKQTISNAVKSKQTSTIAKFKRPSFGRPMKVELKGTAATSTSTSTATTASG